MAEQAGEPAPGRAILRIGENVGGAVRKDQPAPDRELETCFLGRHVGAHDARHTIAIGDPEAGQSQRLGLLDQFLRMRGAVQEGKIGGDGKFRIRNHDTAHAKSPCKNQRGSIVSRP